MMTSAKLAGGANITALADASSPKHALGIY